MSKVNDDKQKFCQLGDVATYVNGYAFKPADWGSEGLPIIRIQDLTGNSYQANYFSGEIDNRFRVYSGDILISWSASLGVFEWQGGDAVLNQHIFKVVFNKMDIDKKFFIHQLKMLLERFASEAHGATMKHLTRPVFNALPFYAPSLSRQQKIASVLERVSNLITLNQQQLSKFDQLAKSRFSEMFGRMPRNEKHWTVVTIRDVVTEVRYGSSRPAVENGQYPYLRMNNITYSGELDLSEIKRIDVPDNELSKCTVRRGDVLFNRTNSKELVGKTCVYNREEMMVLAGFVIRVRLDHEKMLPEFLSAFLNTDFSKQMLLNMCKTAIGQANINAQELQNISVFLPPLQLQKDFVAIKQQLDKSKVTIRKSIEKLETTYRALLQEYFG